MRGEIEIRGDDVGGAHPLESVGTFDLKGIDRPWGLFELTTDPS
jgi:hypothetical protein